MKEIANLKTQLVKTFPQSSKLNARISTHKMSESLRPSTHSSDFIVAIRPISKRRVTRYPNTFIRFTLLNTYRSQQDRWLGTSYWGNPPNVHPFLMASMWNSFSRSPKGPFYFMAVINRIPFLYPLYKVVNISSSRIH